MDLSGFIANCYSSDNIRRLFNLQYITYDSTHPTIALSTDAAKAIDCVELSYLFETLKNVDLEKNFITWIRTLYYPP